MTTSDQHHSQDDEVVTQIQPQITIVANTNAKFPYLKKGEYDIWAMKMQNCITNSDLPYWNIFQNGNSHKKTTKDSSGAIKICPPMSADEHLAVQRETKARTILLSALPDDLMGDFYHLDDAKEIWQAIKARFGGNEESKKMQKSFLKQEFEEFKITEAEDVNLKFLKAMPPFWSQVTFVLKTKEELKYLSFDDLYNKLKSLEFDVKGHAPKPSSLANAAFVSTVSTNNDTISNHSSSYTTSPSYSGNREASSSHGGVVDDIEKLGLEELDLKWQMAMLSIKGHFARECRAKASQDSQRYSAYKTQNAGKKTDDSQALVYVDTFINWQDHEDAHVDEGALKVYGMIAGMENDPYSESEATSEFAMMGFTTDKETKLDDKIANTAKWLQSSKNLFKLIDSSMSVKDKVGLGYGSYENELYIDNEPSIFDSRPEDWLGKPLYSWFTKESDMHGVPPPMTGNYMPTPVHVEIDESQFSYGQKQTNISETSSENVETCESNGDESNESENNNFDSSESNFSVSTLESESETIVESEPNVVMPKVWTDAPIIEEVDSNNEYVVTPGKANKKPSHTDNKYAKFINTPRDLGNKHDSRRHMGKQVGEGYAFPKKACFVCGSLSHLIKDCDFHEKRMAQEQAMPKQTEKTNGMVLLQSGIVDLSSTRPNLSTPVPTGRQNLSQPVTIGRQNLPTPVPTGKAVPAGRPNYPILVASGRQNYPNLVTSGRTNNTGNPHKLTEDLRIVDSGCSRSMTRNRHRKDYWVLVTNPHNKTPYELLTGIVPTINYLKPFGCHVTILNTIDQLGKFDGKSDEGFLVGYSTQGKAYRVYNLASKRVEETRNVKFLENRPNVAQTGPSNATTNNAGSQDTNDSDTDDDQDIIILPSYPSNATSLPSQMEPQDSSSVKSYSSPVVEGTQDEKEELTSLKRQAHEANAEAERLGLEFAQDEEDLVFRAAKSFQATSANAVTPGSTPVTPDSAPFATSTSPGILYAGASYLRYPHPSTFANECATGVPNSKDIYDNPSSGVFTSSSYDDEEPRADLTNMSSTVNVNPTSTKRINSAHPSSLIIGDIASPVQTRSRVNKSSNGESALVCYIKDQRRNNHTHFHHYLFACFLSQTEPRSVAQALEDPSWVEVMQEEMQQFQFQNVWILVDLPPGKGAIRTKWILKNKKDARGIVIRSKARLLAKGHRQEEVIDYDEVFAPVARIEAIRLFLAYASFIGFMVYQMDVKSAFPYGKIKEEAPRAWYATLSTFLLKHGYRRGTIDKTLFIKKDSKDIILVQVYVDDIIFGSTKKAWCDEFEALMQSEFEMSSMGELTFLLGLQVEQRSDRIFISQDKYVAEILRNLESIKTATTPYKPQKPKDKNSPDDDVNVYLYKSMIGSLIIFKYLKGQPKLGLWYPRDSPFELEAYTDSDYAGNHNDRKSTTGGCQFLGRRLISWQCKKQTIVATSSTKAEYVAVAHCCGQSTTLKYAISYDPIIYDSLVKQFWRTASLRPTELGPPAIVATIDGAQYTISEASVRSNL
ncbi:putative ribonuclease H-like domain-containing protein [Tanacetum coccineum]